MILAIDPSGNFNEGKGITGWCTIDEDTGQIKDFGTIDASTSIKMADHWNKHIELIGRYAWSEEKLTVVIEDYILYAHKMASQVNSRFETPKLIGVIEYHCAMEEIPLHFQTAVSVKRRWKNDLLAKKGFINIKKYKKGANSYDVLYINEVRINNHIADAIRHCVHYYMFNGQQPKSSFDDSSGHD